MMNVQSPGRSTGAFVVIACASRLAGDHQVHGLRAFAFLVRFDIETDALTFIQTFQSRLLYCRDVNEHVAPAIIRLDKAVPPLAVEEFYDTRLCHRENSSPHCSAAGPTHGGSTGHSQSGKASATTASVTPPAPTGGGTSLPAWNYTPTGGLWKEPRGHRGSLAFRYRSRSKPVQPKARFSRPSKNLN